jgi:hypothetical protein
MHCTILALAIGDGWGFLLRNSNECFAQIN